MFTGDGTSGMWTYDGFVQYADTNASKEEKNVLIAAVILFLNTVH